MKGLTVTRDRWPELRKLMTELAEKRVLVGIPEKAAPREGEGISNALIGYLNEFGSPAQNIPARPHLIPGVEGAKDRIVSTYRGAAKAALAGNLGALEQAHHRVGLTAQNAVRAKITNGPFPPLADATLAARKARGRTGTKPLIDSGQYRRSITYVVAPAQGGKGK